MDFCPHTWHKGTFRSQNMTDTHVYGENAHRRELPPWRIHPRELLSGEKNPASYDLGFFRHGCGRCLSQAGSQAFSVASGMPVAFSTAWSSVNRTLRSWPREPHGPCANTVFTCRVAPSLCLSFLVCETGRKQYSPHRGFVRTKGANVRERLRTRFRMWLARRIC